jgi:hypothetical protein
VLARRREGILVASFEIGAIGSDLFKAACIMNLEGLVSKLAECWYGTARCQQWRKSRTGSIRLTAPCRTNSERASKVPPQVDLSSRKLMRGRWNAPLAALVVFSEMPLFSER